MVLFVFATEMEFSKVFPETAQTFANAVPSNSLIPLKNAPNGAYASVLGVGILEFSANLSRTILDCRQNNINISSVINVGICGAFPDSGLSILDVVNVVCDQVGDLGHEECDGSFIPMKNLYSAASGVDAPAMISDLLVRLPHVDGVTVNCCTGTIDTATMRTQCHKAQVESMEGAACFAVCEKFGIPAFQIRAVSNIASNRDESMWKIDEAIEALRKSLRRQK